MELAWVDPYDGALVVLIYNRACKTQGSNRTLRAFD